MPTYSQDHQIIVSSAVSECRMLILLLLVELYYSSAVVDGWSSSPIDKESKGKRHSEKVRAQTDPEQKEILEFREPTKRVEKFASVQCHHHHQPRKSSGRESVSVSVSATKMKQRKIALMGYRSVGKQSLDSDGQPFSLSLIHI